MSSSRDDAMPTRLPLMRAVLERVPESCRRALYFETFYSVGSGTFVALFLLSLAALKTVLHGQAVHLMMLGAMFGGSSLLSPLVGYMAGRVPMRLLVIVPNLVTAVLLLAIALPVAGPMFFTCVVGSCFILRVFPRVGEMNMYRVLYPATHRGLAVGWLKAIAAISALFLTVAGTWWFDNHGTQYWVVYAYAACMLVMGSFCYSRIRIRENGAFGNGDRVSPWVAMRNGWKVFTADKRFVRYQKGFALAGFANHMGMAFIPEILRNADYIAATDRQVFVISAVMPAMLIMASSPFWGRFLDKIDPMSGRALFNLLQTFGYGMYCYGGVSRQIWPMYVGAAFHSISNGGGTINWSTGSLYFAKPENVSIYNSWHVGLTGIRGMIAPLCGWLLLAYFGLGPWMFAVCVVLSLAGSIYMYRLAQTDTGSVEQSHDHVVEGSASSGAG
ncbi:Major Facilitator Superfamily protein [Symmachiella dynata]|nr:Major Facilitator Superfamily protein [Symmachiella dynata]